MEKLRQSSPAVQGVYSGAKWMHIRAMLDPEEWEDLSEELGKNCMFTVGKMTKKIPFLSSVEITDALYKMKKSFISSEIDINDLQLITPFALSCKSTSFYQFCVKDLVNVQILEPVIQVQMHFFRICPINHTFHSMVMAQDSIFWGLQFSFPQIFQNSLHGCIKQVDKSGENFRLFSFVRKWMRDHTTSTKVSFENKVVPLPIRWGKKCLSWASSHPQIKKSFFTLVTL